MSIFDTPRSPLLETLAEIFSETEADHKISVTHDGCKNVVIKYDNIDEQWYKELIEAGATEVVKKASLEYRFIYNKALEDAARLSEQVAIKTYCTESYRIQVDCARATIAEAIRAKKQ